MKRLAILFILLVPVSSVFSQGVKFARPPITGIGSVTIDVPDPSAGVDFYINDLGFGVGVDICKGGARFCLGVNGTQRIDLQIGVTPPDHSYLQEVTFKTSDAVQLRKYLIASGLNVEEMREIPKFNRRFSLLDPDGHKIGFIQYLMVDDYSHPENQTSKHLIHAGFVVQNRPAEDHFYKDILGFRPYWHGGMKDDKDDWVGMQVPDGTDWVEYMLNISPTADKHTLGVMNHIALGVEDIHVTQKQLVKNGWKPTEDPKLGRDGKWQLNLYDPDDTRIEFMEFKPKEKPCCSEFTGPHPIPEGAPGARSRP